MIIDELFWYKSKTFTRLKLDIPTDGLEGWKDGDWVYGDKDSGWEDGNWNLPDDTPTTPPDMGKPSDWTGVPDVMKPTDIPEYNNSSSGKWSDFVKKASEFKDKLSDSIENIKDTLEDTLDKINPLNPIFDYLKKKDKEGQELTDLIVDEIDSGRAQSLEEAVQNLKDQGKIRERERNALGRLGQQAFDAVIEATSGLMEVGTRLGDSTLGFDRLADQMRDSTNAGIARRGLALDYELVESSTTSSGKEAQENRYREEIERNKAQAAAQGKPAAEQNVQKKAETVLVESSQPPTTEDKVVGSTKTIVDWLEGRFSFSSSSPGTGTVQPTIPDTPPSSIFPEWAWPTPGPDSSDITLDKTKSGNFSDITWNNQKWEEHVGNSYMREFFYEYDEWKYPKGFDDSWTVFTAIYVRKQNVEEL